MTAGPVPVGELAESPVAPAEYLYGSWSHEDAGGYIVTTVEHFLIVKKTPKRIFYDAGHERRRSVDRQTLEQTGSAYNRSVGAWAPDYQLFVEASAAAPPPPETAAEKVTRLRAVMAAAHPDRGGTADAFRAAYARYQKAVTSLRSKATS
jgi:hypothetical protein